MKRPGGFDRGQEPDPPRESGEEGSTFAQSPDPLDPPAPPEPVRLFPRRRGGAELPDRAESHASAASGDASAAHVAESAEPADLSDLLGSANAGDAREEFADGAELETVPLVPLRAAGDPIRAAKRELKRAERSVRHRERRERKRFTAHARRSRRTWVISIGAVLGLAAFVAIGVLSPLTAVRGVELVGAETVDAEKLQTALARFDGVPLALVRDDEVHRALEPFPLIQRYSIERIPPHTLLIRIEEREAVIAVAEGKRFALRDAAGVLVDTVKKAPRGVPVAKRSAADHRTPAFTAAARIVRDMPADIRKKLARVSASNAHDVTFTLAGDTRVVWGEAEETQRKAVVLRALLKSSAVKSASVIDVSSPETPVFKN